MSAQAADWQLRGSYFESCNCDPICPCRRINGRSGGRSTHGICMGVLSWLIEEGRAGETELGDLAVAMAIWYDDDEEGSPWRLVLYLDERADDAQREALEEIWIGKRGGSALLHFPWAWKASHVLAVRPAKIEADHTRRRQWLRVRDHVEVRIKDVFAEQDTVTCVIPGHHQSGEELEAELIRADDLDPIHFEFHGVCGYAAAFDYSSEERA